MKNLIAHKFALGVFAAFVLAFSVQGVAEALTLTETSPIDQSQRVRTNFEITFSVGLKSDTTQIKDQDGKLIKDSTIVGGAANARIDSSGYLVTVIDGKDYRNTDIDTANTDAASLVPPTPDTPDRPSGLDTTNSSQDDYAPYAVHEKVSSSQYVSYDAAIYANSSGFAFSNRGYPLHYYTAGFSYDGSDADTDEDDTAPAKASAQIKIRNENFVDPVPKSNRYHYNDEAIAITVTSGMSVRRKSGRTTYPVNTIVLPTARPDTLSATTASLWEGGGIRSLPSSITLVCTSETAGVYTVTITDVSPASDFPTDTPESLEQVSITFTLRVTPDTVTIADNAEINPDIQRIPTDDDIEIVSNPSAPEADRRLTFPNATNERIRYRVVKGSGTLYVGTFDGPYGTPSPTLSVHQDSNVYINMNGTSNEVHVWFAGEDRVAPRATIIYEYKGQAVPTTRTTPSTPTPNPTPPPVSTTPTLTLSSTTISGAAGSSQSVTATVQRGTSAAPGIAVTFQVGSLTAVTLSTNANGQASHTFTLPSADTTLSVSANVLGTVVSASATIDVTGTADTTDDTDTTPVQVPTEIFIDGGDDQAGEPNRRLPEDLIVRVVDNSGDGVSGERVSFSIVAGRGRLSPARTFTDADGYADVGFTPQSTGTIEIEASTGNLRPVIFTISTGEPPDAITLVSGNNQSGRPGARLANPLVVEVIDENDDPVSGVSVSFSVTGGGGSVSPTSATTNANGRAQTRLTLGDDPGENTVVASVSGLSDRVTFKATSGMQVHLAASRRPVMYWISSAEGKLYRLAGDAVESLAPNLTGITNIAVDAANNALYLSVQTGENSGEIRRANLNGENVRTLKKITAVPRGITVDSTGDTLYWANSRGRIQSMPTAGSAKLTNVLENLRNPTIVISNGHLYWTESIGRIRRISLTDTQRTIQNIATGLGEPLGLAIAKGKVYWIERAAGGSGSLNRSNLDGSNRQSLKTFASGVPTSLAVDSGDNKLYWTKGAGKLQRSNLAGKFVRDVASGLMGPRGIALSVAVSDGTPVRSTPATQNTQQQTTYSVYDINEDGAVNNADTRLVAADVGNSGAAIKNKRADVDGSGTVDVTDLILVLGNLDDDVAAPAIEIDVKALDVDFDRVQEQVEVLLASGDRSIAAQRALLYLQHLLASARPDETVLLANYPNPFNPETWIPYHLSESTDVQVNIYDAQGTLVRVLTLGHQTAGYYTSRSRAAYWDGKNALGERVASGIYFYQLQTDTVSPMRKMVILK